MFRVSCVYDCRAVSGSRDVMCRRDEIFEKDLYHLSKFVYLHRGRPLALSPENKFPKFQSKGQ